MFDRQAEGRTKTGRTAIGTLLPGAEWLMNACLETIGVDRPPDAVLFRTRTGSAYREAPLAHDFAAARALLFPGDTGRLMDMRRSGTVEAIAGGADGLGLPAKPANSIDRSKHAAQDLRARRRAEGPGCGRSPCAEPAQDSREPSGGTVSTPQSGRVSTPRKKLT